MTIQRPLKYLVILNKLFFSHLPHSEDLHYLKQICSVVGDFRDDISEVPALVVPEVIAHQGHVSRPVTFVGRPDDTGRGKKVRIRGKGR